MLAEQHPHPTGELARAVHVELLLQELLDSAKEVGGPQGIERLHPVGLGQAGLDGLGRSALGAQHVGPGLMEVRTRQRLVHRSQSVLEQSHGLISATGSVRGSARPQQARNALTGIRRQGRRAREQTCLGGQAASLVCPVRRLVEGRCDSGVGADRRGGQMPGAAVGVLLAEGVRESGVSGAPLPRRGGGVDRRAHERMPKGEPLAADPRKPDRLRFVKGRRRWPGSAIDRREIVTVRSGRQQKHAPRIRGQAAGPHEEGSFHALPNRKRIVERLTSRALSLVQHRGHLDQSQRVSPRGDDEPARHRRDKGSRVAVKELASGDVVQAAQLDPLDAPGVEVSLLAPRTASRTATRSASSRRAANVTVCADARSSQWASSTTQSTGDSSLAAASR